MKQANKHTRGPYKVHALRNAQADDVWFYRHPRGGVDVHMDVRDESGKYIFHVSFLVPKDRVVRDLGEKVPR